MAKVIEIEFQNYYRTTKKITPMKTWKSATIGNYTTITIGMSKHFKVLHNTILDINYKQLHNRVDCS